MAKMSRKRELGNCPFCGCAPGCEHSPMCGLHGVPWEPECDHPYTDITSDGSPTVRSADEIRAERDRYKAQAREYGHERQRPEAWLCATIVSVLTWVLGESGGPTVRQKLDQ